ncbi:hypothetical protein [Nocardia farcinica]|uniref:hypothetical protein n=1 Tax=Nocardia farcinica TaxID=37329 RepID=UPI0024557980|nr:hypothetical protein [Nocardia farcinica]
MKIKLAPRWKSSFDPSEYGMSIMNAYHFAIHQVIVGDAEGAYLPSSNLPPLREVASALLRTRTAEEYHALYADLYLVRQYTIFGPGYNRYDEPGLTVVASPSELLSITIDSEWSQTIAAEFIAQDIIDCCNQIRAKRPLIPADSTLDGKTHSEIAARLARHELRLLESEAW